MQNRIDILFKKKLKNILSVFFTAGFPELNSTAIIIKELVNNGVDLIEIGIPFSDPLADGPIIQESNKVALKNGMTLNLLFNQLKYIRKEVQTPLILMGYFNPIMQLGITDFCKKCKNTGIDGAIIPDLPVDEYLSNYEKIFSTYNLKNIFMITPQASEKRIRFIDANSNSFIYAVSGFGTTGVQKKNNGSQIKYFEKLKKFNLKHPYLVGFGISDHKSFTKACGYSSGAIVGSAFIRAVSDKKNYKKNIASFVKKIKS